MEELITSMSIKLKLFGDLKKKSTKQTENIGVPTILKISSDGIEYISDILDKFKIKESEVSHIFVNNRYSGLRKKVASGDTAALFPKNMSLLYKWYFTKEEDR
ncbi:MAG: hypothetical protein GF383_15165 [Candidatus Lokiarchaeota archaeon]|nr:hypothetical protein [Candidatus Lokiarchaeota archaeon]MBD3342859.1 hypothetical protein [Candidatus Lokiarchaeota archaeon]